MILVSRAALGNELGLCIEEHDLARRRTEDLLV
jgi:hypothetical protein